MRPAESCIQCTLVSPGKVRGAFPMGPHTLRATLLSSGSKRLEEGRTVSLGPCRTASPIWHFPQGAPHTSGDTSLRYAGKVTVCRDGLSAVLFCSVESMALSLTTSHILSNMLPSAGQMGVKDSPFPVLSLGLKCTAHNLGFHTHG